MYAILISLLVAVVSVVTYQVTAAEHVSEFEKTQASLVASGSLHSAQDVRASGKEIVPHVVGEWTTREQLEPRVDQTERGDMYETIVSPEQEATLHSRDHKVVDREAEVPVIVLETKNPVAPPVVASSYETKLVQMVFDFTNQERERRGLVPLVVDSELTRIAESHSSDMTRRDFFAHENPDGCALTCRFEEYEYGATAWAENISYIENSDLLTQEAAAKRIIDSWMESGPHRKNILNESYTHTGVALSYNGVDVYVTADYAQK